MDLFVLVWLSSGTVFISDYCREMYEFCNSTSRYYVTSSSTSLLDKYNSLDGDERANSRVFRGREHTISTVFELKQKKK